MKKYLAFFMICALFLSGAAIAGTENQPETRTATILLEGMEETIEKTRWDSADGYAIWYDAARVAPGDMYGHGYFAPTDAEDETEISLIIVKTEIDPADGKAFLGEAVGGYGPEAEISEAVWTTMENGITIGTISATEEGVVYRFYLVTDDINVLCITATFPMEAAEGYGIRFDHMVRTIEFSAE